MLWWDWNTRQRLGLLAAIIAIAATVSLVLFRPANNWGVYIVGTAFFGIPKIMGWLLFVGLRTGRMPSAYGRSELRAENPTWFWLTGGMYAGILLLYLWFLLGVLFGGAIWGF